MFRPSFLREHTMKPPLCIYHGNCADGFAAAWAVRQYSQDFWFHAGFYGVEPPNVKNRDVVIVDFSYKRGALDMIAADAASLLVLDHHASAQEDLCDLLHPGENIDEWQRNVIRGPVAALFDMRRSGAAITWDFFHPNKPRPPLLAYIQDRDLWKFELPSSREVAEWVFSFPYDFEMWDWMMDFTQDKLMEEAAPEGEAILRKKEKDIREILEPTTRWLSIGSYIVPCANLPYMWGSDACHILLEDYPDAHFAAYYWDKVDPSVHGGMVREFGMRSRKGETDVSKIAVEFGGGGHANAAGFRIDFADLTIEGGPPSAVHKD